VPAPKPVDALRQHTRAVLLISADGDASSALLDAIRDSEVPCELIGHPVVAMAELVRLERDNRNGDERTALFVADDDRIDQLSSLFQAVRLRLPQVAIWVIAGEYAVQVQRAAVIEHKPATSAHSFDTPLHGAPRAAPQLRIVEHREEPAQPTPARPDHSSGDDSGDDRADPSAPHSTALTAEELDMLLGWNDDDRHGGTP
jgi:hypothetical protein